MPKQLKRDEWMLVPRESVDPSVLVAMLSRAIDQQRRASC
jgi:hypothetical protein